MMMHIVFNHRMIVIALTLSAITGMTSLVTSCGDNGSFAPPLPVGPSSPSGIWLGPFTSTVNGAIRQVAGVISENNDAQFPVSAISQRHYSGSVAVDGNTLSGTLAVYLGREGPFLGFDGVESIVLDGTVLEKATLFGDYTGVEDSGRFNLNYNVGYEDGSSLDTVSGLWMYSEASGGGTLYTVTFDIDVSGAIFGTDIDGCVYSGQMSIIDARFNAYQASVNVTSCLRKIGNYTGLAYTSSFGGGQVDQILFSMSKPNRAFAALLQKL